MPATKQQPRRLSDAQLEQLLALTADADSVELKLTMPDSERRSTVTALGMDPLNAQIRQVEGVREAEVFVYLRLEKQTYSWGT